MRGLPDQPTGCGALLVRKQVGQIDDRAKPSHPGGVVKAGVVDPRAVNANVIAFTGLNVIGTRRLYSTDVLGTAPRRIGRSGKGESRPPIVVDVGHAPVLEACEIGNQWVINIAEGYVVVVALAVVMLIRA